jgi:hypothetical protein
MDLFQNDYIAMKLLIFIARGKQKIFWYEIYFKTFQSIWNYIQSY